jgi:hypothetical protein
VAQIAAEALVERLIDWGVDTVFGLPGDGINGIMEGLRRHQDKIRFVLVHHEEAAAFMATAHAKATGKLGVCLATSGPGGIHLLNGLYDAKLDHMPVLAITGMQETSLLGTGYQQEVALDKLYADVAEYDMMISNPAQIPAVTDLAIRTAYARRGVAHITIPNDIQVADAGADPWQHVAPASTPKTSAVYLAPPGRRQRQPGRAAAARQGRVRAGEELRARVPARPAAPRHDRDHAAERPDPAAQLVEGAASGPAWSSQFVLHRGRPHDAAERAGLVGRTQVQTSATMSVGSARLAAAPLPVGGQQAECVELAAQRADHPKVALVGGEELISVVPVRKDRVERVGYPDPQIAMPGGKTAGGPYVVDVQVGDLIGAAGQVVDHGEFLVDPDLVQHHVVDLGEHQRGDYGWLGDPAQDLPDRS